MRWIVLCAGAGAGAVEIVGRKPVAGHPLGDGCEHVYLDVGGNVGVQTRKLFEPARYPNGARTLEVFADHFGEDRETWRRTVCAIGFEPNPRHRARLKTLAERYTSLGWRTSRVGRARTESFRGRRRRDDGVATVSRGGGGRADATAASLRRGGAAFDDALIARPSPPPRRRGDRFYVASRRRGVATR